MIQKTGESKTKSKILLALAVVVTGLFLADAAMAARPIGGEGKWGAKKGRRCIKCHKKTSEGLYRQWREGVHGQNGVNCFDCHRAEEGDPDAIEHKGAIISIIVSPKDCSKCHPVEHEQTRGTRHANAADFANSLDNFLGLEIGEEAIVDAGCNNCHGSVVKVNGDGTLDPNTWPNTGVGRVNPDGSRGSCTACHSRHRFSKAQAREPQTCGKCHIGPDNPQMEVYRESKHGILYEANKERLNMTNNRWEAGEDYIDAPTCTTCHMGEASGVQSTHDVGLRLSWNLRSPVSHKINLVRFESGYAENWPDSRSIPAEGDKVKDLRGREQVVKEVVEADTKRETMQQICTQCHGDPFVASFYKQFDAVVNLYNAKFGEPARNIMKSLYDSGILTPKPFDEKIEWIYYEIWHREGRRLRHGASMMGPDYVWSKGMYDLARKFYTEFLPEVEAVANEDLLKSLKAKYVKQSHSWLKKEMTKKEQDQINNFYKERYGE